MDRVTILLADDHQILRQGLRALLEAEGDFEVVGDTGDGIEAVRLAERTRPGVLVTDVVMPGLTGLEVARQAKERVPRLRVVVLSMHASEGYVLEALRNGADAYVLKDADSSELVRAIREVVAGRIYLSPPLDELAITAYVERARNAPPDSYETLTERERQILHLAAGGCSSTAIGERLFISPRTVETHRANLMRKLGLQNHTELVRYAIRRGIIPLE